MAFATLSAATFHWSSSGIPMAASEGERKSAASPGATPRLASTRAHKRSTSTSRASSDTTSASGSRSRHRANESSLHEKPHKQEYRHYTNWTLILCRRTRGPHLQHFLHLCCEPATVDLDIQLVVAEHAEAVDVSAAYRRPQAVSGGGLGVDHDVPVKEDPDTVLQKIVEVASREPVRGDVVGLLGDEQLYVDAALCRVYQVRFHRPVGDEIGVGQIDV